MLRIARIRTLWRIPPQLASSRRRLAVIAASSAAAALAEAAALVLLVTLASTVTAGDEQYTGTIGPFPSTLSLGVPALVLGAMSAMAVRAGLLVVAVALRSKLVAQWEATRRTELFTAYTEAAWSSQADEEVGRLQDLFTDQVRHGGQALQVLAAGLTALTSFLVMVVAAVALHPVAAVAIFGAGALLSTLVRPFAGRIGVHSAEYREAQMHLAHDVTEAVSLAKENRIFGAGPKIIERVSAGAQRLADRRRRLLRLQSVLPVAYQTLAFLLLVTALACVYLLEPGDVATLGALVLVVYRGLNYSQVLQSTLETFNEHAPYVQALDATMATYRSARAAHGSRPLGPVESIVLDDVAFSYDGVRAALGGVAVSARRGDVIGVVGPSGSGKSTLVQLLLRLREPDTGRVLVNDVDAREYSESTWTRRVVAVPQEPLLFAGSVRENIRFFRDDVSDASVLAAAERAHVRAEIEALPGGFDASVGELGGRVSGGQRQRLCIARALAGDPDVIVFDEPTSSLDVHSEARVQAAIEELRGNQILFIVAHRLSTLDICTKILVLHDGRVEAFGRREDLEIGNQYFADALRLSGSSGA